MCRNLIRPIWSYRYAGMILKICHVDLNHGQIGVFNILHVYLGHGTPLYKILQTDQANYSAMVWESTTATMDTSLSPS